MPHSKGLFYEFDCYRLDVGRRVLVRTGEAVSLTPKATDLLIMLVSRAGDLVEKDEMMSQVWPDSFVEEANVSQNIFTLRRALGDERIFPRFIETVAKRGYRFIAPVQTIQSEPVTVVEAVESSGPPTLAVLPLVNTTKDPVVEYLVDGLTDNIINNLGGLTTLHVMSRSSVARYKGREVDLEQTGRELGVDTIMLGKIDSRKSGIVIQIELVDVKNGWQLWGETFDCSQSDILEIQERILKQLLGKLKLKLTGDEEKRITARYTESGEVYQSYLEGRYHWSQYTRKGIETAIGHFRRAIEMDANYALAYAGIVDCYLRLATNYLPPEDDSATEVDFAAQVDPAPQRDSAVQVDEEESADDSEAEADDPGAKEEMFDSRVKEVFDSRVKLRHEWDWKSAERELRRASELKAEYPSAHQWYAAYLFARRLFEESEYFEKYAVKNSKRIDTVWRLVKRPSQIPTSKLTDIEETQVLCAIAREQIDSGNYEAACLALRDWWELGQWPKVQSLNQQSSADLLFTTGNLSGCVASSRQLPKGQKYAEALLNGSIALYEQLGLPVRASEGRIELALCYYRQGLFDLGRTMFKEAIDRLGEFEIELRSLAIIRLASLERHAGRFNVALELLTHGRVDARKAGPWATGRSNLELASSFKELGIAENDATYLEKARKLYQRALYEFEAVGNYRMAAIVLNNLGYMLLQRGNPTEAKGYLLRAKKMFVGFDDKIRGAQVDDSLAQLYLAVGDLELAKDSVRRAVGVMESGDEDASLAESLTTMGLIYCRLGRLSKARAMLESAQRLAIRCGDGEGAARAMIILIEEKLLSDVEELRTARDQLAKLLSKSPQRGLHRRQRDCVKLIEHQIELLSRP